MKVRQQFANASVSSLSVRHVRRLTLQTPSPAIATLVHGETNTTTNSPESASIYRQFSHNAAWNRDAAAFVAIALNALGASCCRGLWLHDRGDR